MQRGVGSSRVTHRGTRFVSPAGSGRPTGLLARGRSSHLPQVPDAARDAEARDPRAAVRRSARSLLTARPVTRGQARTLRHAYFHWTTPRRALRDPRTFRAVTDPR